MTDDNIPSGLTISNLDDLPDQMVANAEGVTRNEDGETRFTLEVVDNAGSGPYEE